MRKFLCEKALPLDDQGVERVHSALKNAAICMAALSKGRELIKGFARMDVEQNVHACDRTLECCLEPPLMHTNFLRDTPFKQMCKCIPLQIGTE